MFCFTKQIVTVHCPRVEDVHLGAALTRSNTADELCPSQDPECKAARGGGLTRSCGLKRISDHSKIRSVSDGSAWGWGPTRTNRKMTMAYTELTVWTRGIVMDKEGRDIVNSVAAAGRLEGKFTQAMENYVDNPDRTNAPTRKYCRVSDSEIENALTYENEHPNIVVLVEQTMVKGWDYMRGMPLGGTLIINTHYSPDYMLRFVPGPERLAQLVCVDAAKIADHKWLYYRLG